MPGFDWLPTPDLAALWGTTPAPAEPESAERPWYDRAWSAVGDAAEWFGDQAERATGWVGSLFDGVNETDPSPSGWAVRGRENPDVTESYHDLVHRVRAGEAVLPEDAAEYAYLNVPGLFTERYPGYMDENTERMRALGLDPAEVAIDTDAGVEANAQAIRDAVLAEVARDGRQVVLTGQSKGGVDISAALALYPELAEHVRAVVSMQAPYGGTPIASDVAASPMLSGAVGSVISGALGGDPRALGDLAYDRRQAFAAAHPYPESVPTVSLVTTSDNPMSLVGPAQAYIEERYGLASDGLVPAADQILPGSDVVRLDDVDHAGSIMRVPGRGDADTPGEMTEALLTLALRRAAAREPR